MTAPERFNLRLYEKDGIQFRAAQVTLATTSREICDTAKEKWFRGWTDIDVCLGEQRGTGPVRPVDPSERPGEIMARYTGTDEIKYYLVVRPYAMNPDRELSPRSAGSPSMRGSIEQRESPDTYQGLARRMSVLRATSFSINRQPKQSNASMGAPVPPTPQAAAATSLQSSPAPLSSSFRVPPGLSRPFSTVADTHAVHGTLIVAPAPAPAPAPVPVARVPDKRKDTAAGMADIRSKIDAIRLRNEEEKRKIDQRVAEEEEEKKRAEELTRKFEEEIEAMRRGDAERRAAAAQSMAGFRKAARPPSVRPTQGDSLIGRRAPGEIRPLSADSVAGGGARSSQLGSISRPPPPRPANAVTNNTPLPPVAAPVRGGGIRIAVRTHTPTPGAGSNTPTGSFSSQASTSPLSVHSSASTSPLSYAAAQQMTAASAAVLPPPPALQQAPAAASLPSSQSQPQQQQGSIRMQFVSSSPRRRSGSMPAFEVPAQSEELTPKLLVTPSKPPSLPPPSSSPPSSPTLMPRSDSPRSPRAMSLLSGQHRLHAGGSRDPSPTEPPLRNIKTYTSPPRTNSSSSSEGDEKLGADEELTQDESELLALEEEYEEMRLAQLPPATEAETAAFVSLRAEDIVFIGTLAEGRLGPVRHAVYNGQEVVVKLISPTIALEVVADRFGWLRNLRHVNIAPPVGICLQPNPSDGQSPGVYVVTEYQAGGTLRLLLGSASLSLPWKLRLAMVVDVAKALLYLHTKGVTHGALRSSSVLVDLNGRLRLSDAGLARRFSDAPRADDSRYAAPEALTSGVFSPQGDAFSFGVLLWEIVHRKEAPFRRSDDGYSAESLLEWPMPAGSMPELQVLLTRCLADEPSNRPSFDDILPRVRAMVVTTK